MRYERLIKLSISAALVVGMCPGRAWALDQAEQRTSPDVVEMAVSIPDGQSGVETDLNPSDVTGSQKPETDQGEGNGQEGVSPDGDPSESGSVDNVLGEDDSKGDVFPENGMSQDPAGQNPTFAENETNNQKSIVYAAHVSDIGWQKEVADGAMAGTTGRALALECLTIGLEGTEGSVEYQAHVAGIGWQDPVVDGVEAGTTGRSLAIEALKIQLHGAAAEAFDVYYRVHSAYFGWLGWARNGEPAGSAGFGYSAQAVEIKLVPRGENFEDYGKTAFEEHRLGLQAHSANIGWGQAVYDDSIAGTTGQACALESLNVYNASTTQAGSVVSQGYVQQDGWQTEAVNGAIGTTGQARALQAVRLRLDGDLATSYDIYYRVHVAAVGWLGWAKNGASAGTVGYDLALEAVQIKLVAKGGVAPEPMSDSYRSRGLNYQAHVANVGWMPSVTDNQVGGTTGGSRALEALCVSLGDQQYVGSITYQAHIAALGWQDAASDGATVGTTGQSLAIQAIKITLEGEIAAHYDVYYRVHSSAVGWLDWAKDGQVAGTVGCALSAEAVQLTLVEKGGIAPKPNENPSLEKSFSYAANIRGAGWQEPVSAGVSGTTGQAKAIEQITMTTVGSTFGGSIQYAVHSSGIGWQDYVSDNQIAGVPGSAIEAFRIQLTGNLADVFDVWYCAHSAGVGWMGWTKNGQSAGTMGNGYQLEAYQVMLLPKGSAAPGPTGMSFRDTWYTQHVSCIYQLPELPTGCESVALTIVLQSMGYGLWKTEIADSYLPRSSWDYVNAYAGNPYWDGGSYNGAMPPALTMAANSYLTSHGAPQRAHNITGAWFDSLYSYVDQGYPVMVWTTGYMQLPMFTGSSLYGYSWYDNEHCVVMYGYDRASDAVLISDPLSGIVWRNASAFKDIYERCGSMSMVIR